MTPLRLALLADGKGDRALLPILTWALKSVAPAARFFEPDFEVRNGEMATELERVSRMLRPDILFIHRDAERVSLEVRRREIPTVPRNIVRVVPVRMTEAWLLVDEKAIRKAAGNPNGRVRLNLPRISRLEALPDPKSSLRALPPKGLRTHVPTAKAALPARHSALRAPRGGVHRRLLSAPNPSGVPLL